MAAMKIYVEPHRVDGLCPKCWNPALREYTVENVDIDGITPLGTRVACMDCKVWVEPMKEYAK